MAAKVGLQTALPGANLRKLALLLLLPVSYPIAFALMKRIYPLGILLPLAVLLGLSQCNKKDVEPVDQLPPATQTGANTLGCLVNGQAWTPQGNDGYSNYSVVYDPNPYGVLDLTTYRYQQSPNNKQILILYARNLHALKSYDLVDPSITRVSWKDRLTGCDFNSNAPDTYHKGTLTITRLDVQAGIISGTFNFTLAKPGCDTVRVTQGRFDKRL
jgi:hypothetical protein